MAVAKGRMREGKQSVCMETARMVRYGSMRRETIENKLKTKKMSTHAGRRTKRKREHIQHAIESMLRSDGEEGGEANKKMVGTLRGRRERHTHTHTYIYMCVCVMNDEGGQQKAKNIPTGTYDV